MNTIPQFFRDKVILITGATGFLGMPLVAKILTDLPDVKRLYLLIRSRTESNGEVCTAEDRLQTEFFTSTVFSKLRAAHGARFDALSVDVNSGFGIKFLMGETGDSILRVDWRWHLMRDFSSEFERIYRQEITVGIGMRF